MKLHLTRDSGHNLFTGYGESHVMVNQQRHERSLIVLPDQIVENWEVAGFEGLSPAHFEFILSLQPELVLLGTGPRLRFPHPQLTQALAQARIGLEAMDTGAACRTYNFLMAEGRRVAAALLLSPES
jgi:uncharacterized protein